MQKKLIALAVAGLAATSAFAQSNVTISGRINHYVETIRNGDGTSATNNNSEKSRTRLTNNSSEIVFSGTEDLGNGLKAWFRIGADANLVDGAGFGLGSRNSGAGFSGSWGQFMAGSWDMYYADHLRATGMGLAWGGPASDLAVLNMGGSAYTTGAVSFGPTRARNQLRYTMPTISGFGGYIAYSAGNTNLLNTQNAENKYTADGADERTWAINGNYNNGPIFASVSYFKTNDVTAFGSTANALAVGLSGAPTKGVKRTGLKLAASYDFSFGTHVGLTWERLKGSESVANIDAKKSAWALNVSHRIAAHNVNFVYGRAKDVTGDSTASTVFAGAGAAGMLAAGNDTGAKYWSLQYDYSLSKRTVVYAGYARLNNDDNAAYNVWGGLGTRNGQTPRSAWLGMSHSF